MRVISLLPSATELLCAVGGENLLVGRSHECDHPASIADRPTLTGQKTHATNSAEIDAQVRDALQRLGNASEQDRSLYTLDTDLIRSLKPDVILTQDLCEVCSIDLNTVRGLAATLNPQPHVLSLNPVTIDDIFDDMLRIGEAVERRHAARDAMMRLRERYWSIREYVNAYVVGPEIAFLEWMDPLFVGGHWTPQLIEQAGGRHALNPPGAKSRHISPHDLLEARPDRLVICPCGYDLAQIERELSVLTEQQWWLSLPAVQSGHVVMIDGNQMFNRPGPRLVDALAWLVGWINDRPEVIPKGFPVKQLVAAG